MRKILVCGSRDYEDYDKIEKTVRDFLTKDTIFIQGGAPGADTLAGQIARNNGVHCAQVDALWNSFGRAAGPLRNAAMLALEPEIVFAFYTNYAKSRGTKNMVKQAKGKGVRVVEIK
jgi:hypothetical protein